MSTLNDSIRNSYVELSVSSKRAIIYARKAAKEGRGDVGSLLRAIGESQAVQARRLFHSLRGPVDMSDAYLAALFENELKAVTGSIAAALDQAEKENSRPLVQALSQLRAVQVRIATFYAQEVQGVNLPPSGRYFICQYCGFIATAQVPRVCPVCTAHANGFCEVK